MFTSELEDALSLETRADLIVRHALEKGYDGGRRATVGFCVGVRHARFMTHSLNARSHTVVAAAVTGDTTPEERRALYARFSDSHDPLEWLFVADVLNEGVDLPAINSLLFLRPTESLGLFLQQLGRGLRLHPGTEVLTVLDFVGMNQPATSALLPLQALSSGTLALQASPGHHATLTWTAPPGCEIILEDRTARVLADLQRTLGRSSATEKLAAAYSALRADLGKPPAPADFTG
ncbi:DEAD/DEAH box helicase [Deinococcus yunweiensis]|uniref:DEAD/DEAH box helicase n=1 Tax=Deinococcus yunweiensis TaxID=367282 RepID=UPI00398E8E0F